MSCRPRSRISPRFGVFPLSIYTKPWPCSGQCIYCPALADIPRSYVPNEDTHMARMCGYSSARQFENRIRNNFREVDVRGFPFEVIVLGGSFSSYDTAHREDYILELYRRMDAEFVGMGRPSSEDAYRCSVLTVESRPDQITQNECAFLRRIGVTKVEIGVQHTDDDILQRARRGHLHEDVVRATRLLKDNGFKVGYHIMLGLPGASMEKDTAMLADVLWREELHPDYLKVYPRVLLRDRNWQPALSKLYESGAWRAPDEEYVRACMDALVESIPPYVWLSRVQRQFKDGELRSGLCSGFRRRYGRPVNDLRSRQVGACGHGSAADGGLELQEYRCGGNRYIEMVDSRGWVAALARVTDCVANVVLREIRVFGEPARVGTVAGAQGRSVGTRLLGFVEGLAARLGKPLAVNAAVGARGFFYKRGYRLDSDDFLRCENGVRGTVRPL